VAILIPESEHRRHARPAQYLTDLYAGSLHLGMRGVGVGRRQPDAGLDPGRRLVVGVDERQGGRRPGCPHFYPSSAPTAGDVQTRLQTQSPHVELQGSALVRNRDADGADAGDSTWTGFAHCGLLRSRVLVLLIPDYSAT